MVAAINRMTNARIEEGIQPMYDDGEVQVWNADARSLPLADESVQLVVTSPPFNCRIAYDGYDDWLPWNDYWHGLIEPSMRECFRVLAPGGRLALNLANVVRRTLPQCELNLCGGPASAGSRPAQMANPGR